MIQKSSSKSCAPSRYLRLSQLQIASSILNGFFRLMYLGLGIWILEEKLRQMQTALPLNWWLAALFQGFTWMLMSFIGSLRMTHLPGAPLRLLATFAFLFAGLLCVLSVFTTMTSKEVYFRIDLDILSFFRASLLFFCAYKGYEDLDKDNGDDLHTPLTGEVNGIGKADTIAQVSSFAKAGFFSRMSFWWSNSLMKRGREKTLEEEYIPQLREADRAESCYASFLERLIKQKIAEPSSQPSILWQ